VFERGYRKKEEAEPGIRWTHRCWSTAIDGPVKSLQEYIGAGVLQLMYRKKE
jgi:hypothetical protein